jgi:hypothetical protein
MLSSLGAKHTPINKKYVFIPVPNRQQQEFFMIVADLLYDSEKVLLPETCGSIDFMPDYSEL